MGKVVEQEQPMYRKTLTDIFPLSLLVVMLIALAGACTGGEQQQEPRVRPLPEERQALRPGEYRSEEFKPSLSFRVGEGWTSAPPETPEHLHIQWEEMGGIGFLKFQEVYEPTRTGTPNVVEAPEDMVGWFRQHPYLDTSKPEPATVGGVEGKRFDLSLGDLPSVYLSVCGSDCVDIGKVGSGGPLLAIHEGEKARVIVLEDVEGETVTIASNSPASEFDEFAPAAQKVIDTMEWRRS
jgi:hypothetical protein